MCGYKDSPDEFQIFPVLIGAFCISDIDFYSADTAAHFSCQYSVGDFGKPFFKVLNGLTSSTPILRTKFPQHFGKKPMLIVIFVCFLPAEHMRKTSFLMPRSLQWLFKKTFGFLYLSGCIKQSTPIICSPHRDSKQA